MDADLVASSIYDGFILQEFERRKSFEVTHITHITCMLNTQKFSGSMKKSFSNLQQQKQFCINDQARMSL